MTPRKGCSLSLFFALAVASSLLFIFALVLQGEIRIGKRPTIRIWLVRETSNQGVGISTTRNASVVATDGAAFCLETKVRFLLWRSAGDIQNAAYCECYAEQGAYLGACTPPND